MSIQEISEKGYNRVQDEAEMTGANALNSGGPGSVSGTAWSTKHLWE